MQFLFNFSTAFKQERLLLDSMYDVPGSDIIGVCVDEAVVAGGKQPLYIRKPSPDGGETDDSDTKTTTPTPMEESAAVA